MTNVLLVDDHFVILEGLSHAISKTMDLAVAGTATNGSDALRLVRAAPPDVLVLDLSMPGIGGLEVLRQLHAEQPELPVLILSMHPEEQYAVRALRAGAAGYLMKDKPLHTIVEAIRQVTAGQKYVSPRTAQALLTRGRGGGRPHDQLSEREFQIMLQFAEGRSTVEISEALFLSQSTVRTYRQRIFGKMKLRNAAELTCYAIREGLYR